MKMSELFEKTLKSVKRSFSLMKTHCCGCSFMKHEGTRSYVENAQIIDGVCTTCCKPIVKQECNDSDICEHEI